MDPHVFLSTFQKFKGLYPDEDVFEVLPLSPWTKQYPKSNVAAERHRIFANMCFQKKNFKYALDHYNSSLSYALPGSSDIPLVYGNRSAVYCEMGKYALAIENIKLARENGFPADKMAKLNDREEKCKQWMKILGDNDNFEADSFFELAHPPNEKIPFIAGCLQLRENDKYGRHIITTKALKAGDIIAIEPAAITFTNELLLGPSCFFCTKSNNGHLLPCDHCTTVMFCSEECREKAALLHPNDAFFKTYSGEKFNKTLKMILDAFRVAGGVKELLDVVKDAEGKTLFDFDFSNPDDPNYEKNMLVALNGLDKNPECVEIMRLDHDLLLNIPPINEKPRSAKDRKKLLRFIFNQCQIICKSSSLFNRHHQGIYLLQALINHHCENNVTPIKFGEKSVLFITRPIKAGGQLLLACNETLAFQAKTELLHTLKGRGSTCDCDSCDAAVNNFPCQYYRNDRRFVEPSYEKVEPAEAIEQFKKNCIYINRHAGTEMCYEVARLIDHNVFLALSIAGNETYQHFRD